MNKVLILNNNHQYPAKGIVLMAPVVWPDENDTSI